MCSGDQVSSERWELHSLIPYNPPMVSDYGPFRERLEEYILELTANHPSLVPMIMEWQDKAGYALCAVPVRAYRQLPAVRSQECQVCVRRCPARALVKEQVWWRGVHKNKVIYDRCRPEMARYEGCGVCMKVCPIQRYGMKAVMEHYLPPERYLEKERTTWRASL